MGFDGEGSGTVFDEFDALEEGGSAVLAGEDNCALA